MGFPPGCLTAALGATPSHPPPWRERGIACASYLPGWITQPRPGPLGSGLRRCRAGRSGGRHGLRAHRRLLAALPVPGTPSPPPAPPRSREGHPTPRPAAPGDNESTPAPPLGPGLATARPGRQRGCGGPGARRSGSLPSPLHPSPSAPLLRKLLFNPAGLRAAAGPPGRPAGKTRSGRRGRRRRMERPGSTWAEAGPSSRRLGPLPRRPQPRGGRWPCPALWG